MIILVRLKNQVHDYNSKWFGSTKFLLLAVYDVIYCRLLCFFCLHYVMVWCNFVPASNCLPMTTISFGQKISFVSKLVPSLCLCFCAMYSAINIYFYKKNDVILLVIIP